MTKFKLMIKNNYINFTTQVHIERAGWVVLGSGSAATNINLMHTIAQQYNDLRNDGNRYSYWVEEDDEDYKI